MRSLSLYFDTSLNCQKLSSKSDFAFSNVPKKNSLSNSSSLVLVESIHYWFVLKRIYFPDLSNWGILTRIVLTLARLFFGRLDSAERRIFKLDSKVSQHLKLLIQWAPLNGINRLMESPLSRMTSPKLFFYLI